MYIVMYSFYLTLFVVLILTSMSTFATVHCVRDCSRLFVQVSWLTIVSEDFVPKIKVDYNYKLHSNNAVLL